MDDAAKNAYIAELEAKNNLLETGMGATVGLIAGATGSKSTAVEATFMQWRRGFPLGQLSERNRTLLCRTVGISDREFARLERKFKTQNPKYNQADPAFDPAGRRQPMVTPKKVVRQALADNTLECTAKRMRAAQRLTGAALDVLQSGFHNEDPRYNATEVSKVMTGCVLQRGAASQRERKATFRPTRRNRRQNDAA
ncbi:hypothetical protein SEMRO_2154_G316840.1 [Seminavis robusta]|uniref:Uncharacterized protein n=1 Tax=Seminavis robusta TaxID=568900 RepID=A0A9N8EXF6_9STRA|nr:hypothetical protein SEMRO_2154_G316840.1 [Seminavis robusta]|eukprot:Sro2154_g316840.1 n/a (197) ;mRNA; f:15809-16399